MGSSRVSARAQCLLFVAPSSETSLSRRDLDTENCKILAKEIEEDTNKWEDSLCSWIGKINLNINQY